METARLLSGLSVSEMELEEKLAGGGSSQYTTLKTILREYWWEFYGGEGWVSQESAHPDYNGY